MAKDPLSSVFQIEVKGADALAQAVNHVSTLDGTFGRIASAFGGGSGGNGGGGSMISSAFQDPPWFHSSSSGGTSLAPYRVPGSRRLGWDGPPWFGGYKQIGRDEEPTYTYRNPGEVFEGEYTRVDDRVWPNMRTGGRGGSGGGGGGINNTYIVGGGGGGQRGDWGGRRDIYYHSDYRHRQGGTPWYDTATEKGFDLLKKSIAAVTSEFTKLISPMHLVRDTLNQVSFMGILSSAEQIEKRAYTASAYGVNPNALGRLGATYGRMFDSSSVLGNIATSQAAIFSLPMAMAGIGPQQARGMSSEALMGQFARRARQFARDPRWGANDLTLQATGLGQLGFTTEDLLRLRNMGDEEFESVESYNRQAQSIQLRNPRRWRDFQMKRQVGQLKIETGIQNMQEEHLLGPIEHAIDAFTTDLSKHSGVVEKAFKYAGTVIEDFAKNTEKEGFYNAVWKIIDRVFGDLQKGIEQHFPKFYQAMDSLYNIIIRVNAMFDKLVMSPLGEWLGMATKAPETQGANVTTKMMPELLGLTNYGDFGGIYNKIGSEQHVSPMELRALAIAESNENPSAQNPESSAHGIFQMTQGTAKNVAGRYVSPRELEDPKLATELAAKYLNQIMPGTRNPMEGIERWYWGEGGAAAFEKDPTGYGTAKQREGWKGLRDRLRDAYKGLGGNPADFGTDALERMPTQAGKEKVSFASPKAPTTFMLTLDNRSYSDVAYKTMGMGGVIWA